MSEFTLNRLIYYKKINDDSTYHLYDGINNQHYVVTQKEIAFWEALNNHSSLSKLEQTTPYSKFELQQFLKIFEDMGLINPQKSRPHLRIKTAIFTKGRFSIFIENLLKLGLIGLLVCSIFSLRQTNFIEKMMLAYSPPKNAVIVFSQILFVAIFSVLFHELGHFIFAINRNIMVPYISLNLKKGIISVDTTGIQFLENAKDIITIYFAGPLCNLILAGTFFVALTQNSSNSFVFLCGFLINLLFFLLNINILFSNSDGQKIVCTLTNSSLIANYMRLFFYVKNRKAINKPLINFIDFLWTQKIIVLVFSFFYVLFALFR